MSLFSRIRSLFTSRVTHRVEQAEYNNPEAPYEQHLAERQKQAEAFAGALGALRAQQKADKQRLAGLVDEYNQTQKRLQTAIRLGREDDGALLIVQSKRLNGEIEALTKRIEADDRQNKNLTEELQNTKISIAELQRDKASTVAQIRSQQARQKAAIEATTFGGETPSAKAITRLKERTLAIEETLTLKNEIAGGPGSSMRELDMESAREEFRSLQTVAITNGKPIREVTPDRVFAEV